MKNKKPKKEIIFKKSIQEDLNALIPPKSEPVIPKEVTVVDINERLKELDGKFANKALTITEKKNILQAWKDAREAYMKELFPEGGPTKETVEKLLNLEIQEILNNSKGGFFKFGPYLDLPWWSKYGINTFFVQAMRNIGKSTSSWEEIDKEVSKGNQFMIIRQTLTQLDNQIRTDQEARLEARGWEVKDYVVRTKNTEEVVGYYIPLATAINYKSTDYPKVNLIFFDEATAQVRIKDYSHKLISFIITVQRHNKNLRLLLATNPEDQDHEVFGLMGIGGEMKILDVNFLTGTMFLNIPDGIYNKGNDKSSIGHKYSLNNFEEFSLNFGGLYKDKNNQNIAPTPIKSKKFELGLSNLFVFVFNEDNQYIFQYHEREGYYYINPHSDDIYPDMVKFTFNPMVTATNTFIRLGDPLMFLGLVPYWTANLIYCDTRQLRDLVSKQFLEPIIKKMTQ